MKTARKSAKRCKKYQLLKITNKKKYGLLSEKKGKITKWSSVNVNLWGPKIIENITDIHIKYTS